MTVTADHIRKQFRWLVSAGIDAPTRFAGADGEAAIRDAAETYAEMLNEDATTVEELGQAVRVYLRRPMGHGGRRPFPDAGMLADAVREVRIAACPKLGDIAKDVRLMLTNHLCRPGSGFDTSKLPAAARDIVVEAVIAARVVQRMRTEEQEAFWWRDLEREYEARRGRA